MAREIFRKAALERLSTPEQLDQLMRVTTPTGWLALVAVAGLLITSVIWSVMSTVPVKVNGEGILISPSGVLNMVSSAQGRVEKFLVTPGERVTAGQQVAIIDQPDIRQSLDSAIAELEDAQEEHTQLIAFHKRERDNREAVLDQKTNQITQSVRYLSERKKWLEERLASETRLAKKGIVGKQKPIDTQIELNQVLEEIVGLTNQKNTLKLDENTTRISKEREVLDSQFKLNTLLRKAEDLKSQFDRQTAVVSPYNGRVVEFQINEGEVVRPGATLFSLVPDEENNAIGDVAGSDLVAVLYIPPAEGKKVRAGMEVQIAPSTVKREEYGFIVGTVQHVAEIPSTPEGMLRVLKNQKLVESLSGDGAPFQVVVHLEKDAMTPSGFKWSSSKGPDTEVNTGTICDGSITTRNVHLISLVIPALEQLFKEDSVTKPAG